MNNISIIDKDYTQWVKNLALRYRKSQIKAAVKVNQEQLFYNYQLGHDIVEMHVEERWGQSVITQLSVDLRNELPEVQGLSKTNLYYCKKFYQLYSQTNEFFRQLGGKLELPEFTDVSEFFHQLEGKVSDKDARQRVLGIFMIPWRHHCVIMDKVNGDEQRALFYVHKTIENNWSRAALLNFIGTDLYEREGNAVSNYAATLPAPMSDLAQAITKDPYNFAFAGITNSYNETALKSALLTNITNFLIELGAGFAYVGREYRLEIGNTEKFIDLLFYHLHLRCYVVVEVKVDKFDSKDVGQIGTYMVACNHIMRHPDDNPTIGILICRGKDRLLAQYALESSNQPISISEYDLERLYPTKVAGLIPSIEEIENLINK